MIVFRNPSFSRSQKKEEGKKEREEVQEENSSEQQLSHFFLTRTSNSPEKVFSGLVPALRAEAVGVACFKAEPGHVAQPRTLQSANGMEPMN